MDKQQKIMNSTAISRLLGVRYIYFGLGATLAISLIPFTAISSHPAFAAQAQNNSSGKITNDSVQANIESENSISLGQKNNSLQTSQKVKSGKSLANAIASKKSDLNADLINLLRSHRANQISPTSDLNADLKNSLKKKNNSQQIAQQIDPSEGLGDTLQNLDQLRQELLIDPIVVPGETPASRPGSTAGTPTAYGANWGQAFIGGGLNFPLEDGRTDGALGIGFGLGNALKSVGLEVTASISSVDTSDFGDSGGLGFKIHKAFNDGTAIAAGWSNVVKWGDADGEKDTIYGVVTRAFPLQPNNTKNTLPLTVSLGVGTGGFRSIGAIQDGNNALNFFGGLGLRVAPQVSLVSSWTGSSLNVGSSFAPFPKVPVIINTYFTDVTSNTREGTGLSLTAGYAFQF